MQWYVHNYSIGLAFRAVLPGNITDAFLRIGVRSGLDLENRRTSEIGTGRECWLVSITESRPPHEWEVLVQSERSFPLWNHSSFLETLLSLIVSAPQPGQRNQNVLRILSRRNGYWSGRLSLGSWRWRISGCLFNELCRGYQQCTRIS